MTQKGPIAAGPQGGAHLQCAAVGLLGIALAGKCDEATLQVEGSCMAPLIEAGDTISVRGIAKPPTIGCIVVAQSSAGPLVCHRVLRVGDDGRLWIAGDASRAPELIPIDAVLGIVAEVRRGNRRLTLFPQAANPAVSLAAASRALLAAATRVFGFPGRRSTTTLWRLRRWLSKWDARFRWLISRSQA